MIGQRPGRYALLLSTGILLCLLCTCTARAAEIRMPSGTPHMFCDTLAATEKPEIPPAWDESEESKEDELYLMAETMPKFQGGGINKFRTWIFQHMKYPQAALKRGISGSVLVSFVVTKNGSMTQIEVLSSPHNLLTHEVIRVLSHIPPGSWTPGIQEGRKVNVKYTLPLNFRL